MNRVFYFIENECVIFFELKFSCNQMSVLV